MKCWNVMNLFQNSNLWILTKHGTGLTHSLLRKALENAEHTRKNGGKFHSVDITGKEVVGREAFPAEESGFTLDDPLRPWKTRPCITIQSIQQVAEDNKGLDEAYKGLGKCVITFSMGSLLSEQECSCKESTTGFAVVEKEWQDSSFCKELKKTLTEHAKTMKPVNRVVCFGLGKFDVNDRFANTGCHSARAYIQHCAALTIRDVLLDKQERGGSDRIDVIAQDPAYCENCKSILQERYGITILDHPKALLECDEHTVVMSISADPDIPQWVSHIVADTPTGLAGLFCNWIVSKGEHEKSSIGSSPILWKWIQECVNKGFFLKGNRQDSKER